MLKLLVLNAHCKPSILFIIQATTTGPRNPLQSQAPCSRTWLTRSFLTRSLTPRSRESAQPPSVKWIEKTALHPRKKRKKRGPLWSTAWLVRDNIIRFSFCRLYLPAPYCFSAISNASSFFFPIYLLFSPQFII